MIRKLKVEADTSNTAGTAQEDLDAAGKFFQIHQRVRALKKRQSSTGLSGKDTEELEELEEWLEEYKKQKGLK